MRINCRIDPRDDIPFLTPSACRQPDPRIPSDGWRTLSELMLLIEEAGYSLTEMQHVLEFASGWAAYPAS